MSTRFLTIGSLVLLFIGAVGLGWLLTRPASSSSTGTLAVVAGENFWGDITEQLGGSHVHVTSIINDPNTDPHLYESSAADAAAVANADLVIANGAGYDDFLTKLLSVPGKANRTVLTAATILGASGSDANPHLWYDIPRVPMVAGAITNALIAKDPADKATFSANLAAFDASLQPLDTAIGTIKTEFPGAPVAYTERVPGYLLADADLTVKTPAGFASAVEDGNDPSPADTATFESLIANHQIRVLLYNSQVTSSVTEHIRSLAVSAGIPMVGLSETNPNPKQSYQTWQLGQITAILNALKQS